jgi:predicted RNA-binding Zn-ribbon protein involved in translation (DUF1610 family)
LTHQLERLSRLAMIETGPRAPHIREMPLATPLTTFGDLARDHLQVEVTCGNCGHRRTIDAASPRLRNRKIAGARFRCEQCGSVGLPTIGKQRRWPSRLADHARKLR